MSAVSYFSQMLGRPVSENKTFRLDNPFDGRSMAKGDKALAVNIKRNQVKCFRTGYSNSIIGFIMQYAGISYDEAVQIVGEPDTQIFYEMPTLKAFEYPKHRSLLSDGVISKRARKYLTNRNLDIEYLDMEGWTYCWEGRFKGRILIPFYIDNKLQYYVGRSFIGEDPKYLNPSADECGFGSKDVFYNQDALKSYNQGFIVEGIFDALAVGDNAIACLGWSIPPQKLDKLLLSNWDTFHFITDPGFATKTIPTVMTLLMQGKTVYVHKTDDYGYDIADIGMDNFKLSQTPIKMSELWRI